MMDLSMPELNGLEATREILKILPSTRVLVLTSSDDEDWVRRSQEAGAVGYLTKRSAASELAEAIRAVAQGETFISRDVAKRLRERERSATHGGHSARKRNELTQRESEVLQLIADGFPNKKIAAELGISVKTVEKHRQSVMNKLNIHETAGLTRFAVSKQLVPEKIAEPGGG
jgi:DNA-binding NarL/FixJ family response regulator